MGVAWERVLAAVVRFRERGLPVAALSDNPDGSFDLTGVSTQVDDNVPASCVRNNNPGRRRLVVSAIIVEGSPRLVSVKVLAVEKLDVGFGSG